MLSFNIPSPEFLIPKEKPIFSKPTEISCFSYDSSREFHPDRSELKQYKPGKLSGFLNSNYADLNVGRDKFIKKPDDYQEHLDGLLKSLKLLPRTEKCADFVTWRGILTRIICTPFKRNEEWNFNVMRRGNTIYIEDDKAQVSKTKKFPKQDIYTYWGHRFESIVMESVSDNRPDSLQQRFNESVNTWSEFELVLKAKLGKHRLVFGAEVDGVDADGRTYVELKTNRILRDSAHYQSFYQLKLITYWAQCFLAGIRKVLVGFRTDQGIIKSLEYIDVNEIPRVVRGKVTWCPESMLNFGSMVLDWLSATMWDLPEDCVYRMNYCCTDSISLTSNEGYEPFIPDDFKDAFYY